MKRIFVGIPISEELQKEILEWQMIIYQDFDLSLNPSPTPGEGNKVRWLAGKNLHITLVPPWQTSHEAWNMEHKALNQKLQEAAKNIKPFVIRFEKISFGPNIHQPRLIWASSPIKSSSFADDSEAVFNGVNELRLKIYDALGQQPENRPFQLHVTLARFRAEDFEKFAIKKLNEKADWKMKVENFALYQSHLSPLGADYEILAEFHLN
jgi:2'-5' RNA ligase